MLQCLVLSRSPLPVRDLIVFNLNSKHMSCQHVIRQGSGGVLICTIATQIMTNIQPVLSRRLVTI